MEYGLNLGDNDKVKEGDWVRVPGWRDIWPEQVVEVVGVGTDMLDHDAIVYCWVQNYNGNPDPRKFSVNDVEIVS